MEENNQQKKNKLQQIYHHAQTSFFNIMFELLKEKKTSKWFNHYIFKMCQLKVEDFAVFKNEDISYLNNACYL
jgi:hypothetical protein